MLILKQVDFRVMSNLWHKEGHSIKTQNIPTVQVPWSKFRTILVTQRMFSDDNRVKLEKMLLCCLENLQML